MRSSFPTRSSHLFPLVVLGTFISGLLCSAPARHDSGSVDPSLIDESTSSSSSCELNVDGTCISSTSSSRIDSSDGSEIAAVALPEPDEEGFIDIGYGDPQVVADDETRAATLQRLQQIIHYMETTVHKDDKFSSVRDDCLNRNKNCAFWASIDECNLNPAFMLLTCAPACFSCEQLEFETRCPVPEGIEEMDIWKPGDLDRMAQRILRDYSQATVLAKPNPSIDPTDGEHSKTSWLIQVDDFLTEQECDTLIELGTAQGYEVSTDVGDRKFDGTYGSIRDSNSRTSTNTWCHEQCYENATTKEVLSKLEQLTGIPDSNAEHLQLLRYNVGEFYRSHHDYIEFEVDREQGVRILTVFLYLNDVEQGGGTHFTNMGITCQPKRGRVVLWPSVENDHPNRRNENTYHEALPVEKGVKYAANAWYHLRDFKTPHKKGCD